MQLLIPALGLLLWSLWWVSWRDECPVISVPFVLALPHITAAGRREDGDFMGPCSKGPDLSKVPLSCCSVPVSDLLLTPDPSFATLFPSSISIICSFPLLALAQFCCTATSFYWSWFQVPALCFPFQQLFLGHLPVARGSSSTQSHVFFSWKTPSLDCYFFPGSASRP